MVPTTCTDGGEAADAEPINPTVDFVAFIVLHITTIVEGSSVDRIIQK